MVQGDFFGWMSRILQMGGGFMKSLVIKRSVVVAGHKTSVSLEDAFWKGLKEIAGERDTTLSQLVGTIDSERRSVVVTINDRGPFVRGRVIDVTPAAARALGFPGVARVAVA